MKSKQKKVLLPVHVIEALDARGIKFADVAWAGIAALAPDLKQYRQPARFQTGEDNPRYNPDLHEDSVNSDENA